MKLSEINEGDTLTCDGGFSCMDDGDTKTVHANGDGELYVPCSDGRHYLIGQVGDDGDIVGLCGGNN